MFSMLGGIQSYVIRAFNAAVDDSTSFETGRPAAESTNVSPAFKPIWL